MQTRPFQVWHSNECQLTGRLLGDLYSRFGSTPATVDDKPGSIDQYV